VTFGELGLRAGWGIPALAGVNPSSFLRLTSGLVRDPVCSRRVGPNGTPFSDCERSDLVWILALYGLAASENRSRSLLRTF